MIVINDTLGVRGGTMTLLYRMCKWCLEHGEKAAVLYESDGNEEIKTKIESMGVKTYCVGFFNLRRIRDILSSLIYEESEVKVINYNLNHYLDIECVRSRYRLHIKNIMYVIHPDCLKKGYVVKNSFVRDKYKDYYYGLITKMISNKALVFMDIDSVDATNNFYGKEIAGGFPIIPLPIDIPKVDNQDELINIGYESNTILTAARADFPFKGYLLGLIDVYSKLKKSRPNARLKIFSEGKDIDRLRVKIDSLDEEIRKDVELQGWIDYGGLIEEIKKCRVFIGASTGLLDSSKYYRVSIPVKHSTDLCISLDYFYKKPLLLSEAYEKGMKDKCLSLMLRVFECSFDEYKAMSVSSFDAVNLTYNEDVVMMQLVKAIKANTKKCMSGLQCRFHGMYQFMNKYRFGSTGERIVERKN